MSTESQPLDQTAVKDIPEKDQKGEVV